MKLFSTAKLKERDPQGVLESVLAVPEQAEHAWKDSRKVRLPKRFLKAKHIAICGMGGSLLGPHMLQNIFVDRLHVPLTLVNGYTLPASVDRNTFVVLSSYSGTTEEVLACAREARKRTSMRVGISLGGKLLTQLRREGMPYYHIVETYNPSNQPRVGVGYSVFGQLGLLRTFFGVRNDEVHDAISHTKRIRKTWTQTTQGATRVRDIVRLLKGRMPVFVAAEFLSGNAHVFQNQSNESGKMFARYHIIPELNHHLLEGLDNPKDVVRKSVFVFLDSALYHERNRKRMRLTRLIAEKQGAKTYVLSVRGGTKLAAGLEALFISGLVTTAFAVKEGIDPVAIKWVNYFKKQLAK